MKESIGSSIGSIRIKTFIPVNNPINLLTHFRLAKGFTKMKNANFILEFPQWWFMSKSCLFREHNNDLAYGANSYNCSLSNKLKYFSSIIFYSVDFKIT